MWILLLLMAPLSAAQADIKIVHLSDIHVMSPELVAQDGSAWQDFLAQKRTMLDLSKQLFEEQVDRLLSEKPDMVLITGDLTKDGEVESHECVVRQLDRLHASGIKAYVIPGDHDLGTETSFVFHGDQTTPAKTVDSSQFAELYQQYGYGSASERDPNSLSYACEPFDGLVLIGIVTDRRGNMAESTLEWVCSRAEQSRAQGKQVLAMMHFLPFPHVVNLEKLKKDYVVKDYETVRNRLADAGIRVVLTGHLHVLEMAKDYNADCSAPIYEVITSSLAAYPCAYRCLTFNDELSKLAISTQYVTSLSGFSDFPQMAKDRLRDGVSRVYANEFKVDVATGLVADGVIIHSEGNEDQSSASVGFWALYEGTQFLLRLSGVLDEKLSSYGLTWDDVGSSVASMLTDTSSYGISEREDKTDDLTLAIDLPKQAPSAVNTVIKADDSPGPCFTLQGVRVAAPRKGLYIKNGQLVIEK